MDIPRMKQLKEDLMACVEYQAAGGLDKVDTKEMGEVIDMVKDLSEALYYCEITKAMQEGPERGGDHRAMYYDQRMMPMDYYPVEYYDPRYRERYMPNTMYAQNGGSSSGGSSNGGNGGSGSNGYSASSRGNNARGGGSRGYYEGMMPMDYSPVYEMEMRDPKEGRSGQRRKMYMEGKMLGKEKTKQIQELDGYMQELTHDLTEMIQDASPEEKQLLQQKISTLATKIK